MHFGVYSGDRVLYSVRGAGDPNCITIFPGWAITSAPKITQACRSIQSLKVSSKAKTENFPDRNASR